MAVLSIILTAMLLAYVEGTPVDCGEIYQKILGDVVTMKKNCDTARIKDCCQVDQLYEYKFILCLSSLLLCAWCP